MLKRFSRAEFKQWLESKPLDCIVGRKGSCPDCPLAAYVQSVTGHLGVFMTDLYFYTSKDGAILDTPLWAKRFIYSVDSIKGSAFITAAQALEALRAS